MFSRLMLVSVLALSFAAPAFAEEAAKPDDTVSFDLSAEDWVAAKTAHVVVDVETAVNTANAGAIRADMIKAVNDAAKADWRMTSFSRMPDQTGMERWSVNFDARLPETALNGLPDTIKKASKAGMQITVATVDFNPTLEEMEAARAALRVRILKAAAEQLTAMNGALPGRNYRLAQVTFEPGNGGPLRIMRRQPLMAAAMSAPAPAPEADEPEHAQRLVLNAHIVFAALPAVVAASH